MNRQTLVFPKKPIKEVGFEFMSRSPDLDFDPLHIKSKSGKLSGRSST